MLQHQEKVENTRIFTEIITRVFIVFLLTMIFTWLWLTQLGVYFANLVSQIQNNKNTMVMDDVLDSLVNSILPSNMMVIITYGFYAILAFIPISMITKRLSRFSLPAYFAKALISLGSTLGNTILLSGSFILSIAFIFFISEPVYFLKFSLSGITLIIESCFFTFLEIKSLKHLERIAIL